MSTRNYNKLYVHTDREEGEKILLGYENDTKELILEKNTETIFHIPYYTEPVNLATSSLIQDGATAGTFPAAADRIFKNLKDYGKTTANGEPSDIADGVWYCSWLYKDENGQAQWMDRYYNPGSYVQDIAFSQLSNGLSYKKHDPVYRDVPTKMLLEQGVQYRYFHVGEKYATEMVTSFGGVTGEHLKLNLTGWGTSNVDNSTSSNKVFVNTDGPPSKIYTTTTESDRVTAYNINFNNSYKTAAFVEYNESYGLLNEYTTSFWAYSPAWNNSQSTQLVGNYTSKGGTGVFLDTLSSYPFFVIPETGYGHLLYVNDGFNQFLDRSLHPAVSLTATPLYVAINSDNDVIVVNADQSNKIKKLDHAGRVMTENYLQSISYINGAPALRSAVLDQNTASGNATLILLTIPGWTIGDKLSVPISTTSEATSAVTVVGVNENIIEISPAINVLLPKGTRITNTTIPKETPRQLLCGRNDEVIVITDKHRFTYDTNLNLLNTTRWETLSTTVAAFAYNVELDTAELISVDNVKDGKFLGLDYWCLTASNDYQIDGNLYVKRANSQEYVLFAELNKENSGSAFAIDPYDRLWVMHSNNKISIYDSSAEPKTDPLFRFSLGANYSYAKKNINFICTYDRNTGTREWKGIIYYGDTTLNLENPRAYVINMKGQLVKTIDILSLFDLHTIQMLKQSQENMDFFGNGDFTGYEHRRVFNKLSPFKNTAQIVLKTMLKDTSKTTNAYTLFKDYYSTSKWNSDSWQHLAVTLKNRRFSLYSNGNLAIEIPYSGKYEMTYELQPALFIGSPVGAQYGFNEEIGKYSAIFNGLLQDVKIYDYAIDSTNMEMFQRASIPAQNIYWTLPTPSIQYIETIERMFKNKIPGAKSSFFNVNICGTKITDLTTRAIIEEEVRNLVEQIKPAYASFLKVNWVD